MYCGANTLQIIRCCCSNDALNVVPRSGIGGDEVVSYTIGSGAMICISRSKSAGATSVAKTTNRGKWVRYSQEARMRTSGCPRKSPGARSRKMPVAQKRECKATCASISSTDAVNVLVLLQGREAHASHSINKFEVCGKAHKFINARAPRDIWTVGCRHVRGRAPRGRQRMRM